MIPARIVLDTNVCLDLFVFRDPASAKILMALRNGDMKAFTNEACREEWLRVIDYPQISLAARSRQKAIAEFDSLVFHSSPDKNSAIFLPTCSDADDQKFLELARDIKADFLVTKDKALLKLNRKTATNGLFSIIRPMSLDKFIPY